MLVRRTFLSRALLGLPLSLLSLSAWLAACGSSASSGGGQNESDLSDCSDSGSCDKSGVVNVSVSGAHSHDVPLTQDDLDQGKAVTLTLTGQPTHTHTLKLSSAKLSDIDDGSLLMVESSTDAGHSHCISFNCGMSSGGGGGYGY